MTASLEPRIIRASAGSGKTFQLSNRYLLLLLKGEDPASILATTFTRKAAGEIFERILERLAAAAETDAGARVLKGELNIDVMTREMAVQALRKLVSQQFRVQVATLDSFFLSLFTTFASELGLPPGWTLRDEEQDEYFWQRCLTKFAEELTKSDELLKTVRQVMGGKTKRSIHNSLKLSLLEVYDVYLESRQNGDAWGANFLQEQLPEFPSSDFQKLLRKLDLPVNKAGKENGHWKKAVAALDGCLDGEPADCSNLLLKNGFLSAFIQNGSYHRIPFPADFSDLLSRLLEEVRTRTNQQVKLETYSIWCALSVFEKIVNDQILSEGLPGFNDVKHILSRLLTAGLLDHAYYRLDTRISHVLFDEFQDTSYSEFRLLLPFIQELFPDALESRRSFFCVGDRKQAIYGWRGGSAEILTRLDKLLGVSIKPEAIDKTYRCSHTVVDCVNAIYGELSKASRFPEGRTAIERFGSLYGSHTSLRKAADRGYVTLSVAPDDPDSEEDKIHGELSRIVDEIKEKDPDGSIGILVRRNSVVSALTDLLRREGHKVSNTGGRLLKESPAVAITVSMLRFLDSPGDEAAWYHLQNTISEFKQAVSALAKQNLWMKWHATLAAYGYASLFLELRKILDERVVEEDKRFLEHLMYFGTLCDDKRFLRPRDALRMLNLYRVEESESGSLQIMTIHQSKGLAFDHVVLPELDFVLSNEKQIPGVVFERSVPGGEITGVIKSGTAETRLVLPEQARLFELAKQNNIEESLCLFYVAITRAKEGLHFITSPKSNEQAIPFSWGGILRSTLAEFFQNSEVGASSYGLYDRGFSDWSAKPRTPELSLPFPPDLIPDFRTVIATPAARISWETPSSHGHNQELPVMIFNSERGTVQGSLVHQVLQKFDWIENGAPSRQAIAELVSSFSARDHEPTIELVHQFLNSENTSNCFRPEFFKQAQNEKVTLYNEYALLGVVKNECVSAIIDRLIIISSEGKLKRAVIIDYKSDRIDEGSAVAINQKIQTYRPQLELYRQLLSSVLGLTESSIQCYLGLIRLPLMVEVK